MARIRTVKPEFFKHYDLYKAEEESGLPLRVAYSGLWTCADKEGRFKWQPAQLKLDVLPYDQVDFDQVLTILERNGFIIKYSVDNKWFGCIPTLPEHQRFSGKEAQYESKLPPPPKKQPGSVGEVTGKQPGINGECIDASNEILNDSFSTNSDGKQPGSIWEASGNPGKERIIGKEEGKGKERNKEPQEFFGNGNLIPEMKNIWLAAFPHYTFDQENDYPALLKISDFILKIAGKKIGFLTDDDEIKTLNSFQLIADQVNREPFWANKPLKTIYNHIQEFYNKIKNPIDAAPKQQQNGRSTKIDDDKLKQKLAAKLDSWKQNSR